MLLLMYRSLLVVARKQPLEEVAHFKDLVKFVTAPVPKQLVSEYRSVGSLCATVLRTPWDLSFSPHYRGILSSKVI